MELISQTRGKNDVYLVGIARKYNDDKITEPLSCNVIGVLDANRTGGIFCTTPCGREYRVSPSEKKDIQNGTTQMLSLWCAWARSKIVSTR